MRAILRAVGMAGFGPAEQESLILLRPCVEDVSPKHPSGDVDFVATQCHIRSVFGSQGG